jgi:hypothetical protein
VGIRFYRAVVVVAILVVVLEADDTL